MLQRLEASLVKFKSKIAGAIERVLRDKLSDVINLKDFGAKGDGVTDDTDAVQLAINAAISSKKKLGAPAGNYRMSRPIEIVIPDHYSKSGLTMVGEGRASTIFWFPHNGDGFKVKPINEGDATYNLVLKNFDIKQVRPDGAMTEDDPVAGTSGIGLHVTSGASGLLWDNLRIAGFKQCIKFDAGAWICSFTNLSLSTCEDGIIMGNMGTTLFYDNIFVYGSTGKAYKLTGVYSSIGSLACDGCTGTPYEFDYFSGSIGSLGYEAYGKDVASTIYKMTNSNIQLGHYYCIELNRGGKFKCLFELGGTNLTLGNGVLEKGDDTNTNLPGQYMKQYRSKVNMTGKLKSDYIFAFTDASLDADAPDSTLEIDGVKFSHGNRRPFLGSNNKDAVDRIMPGKDLTMPLFLHDCYKGFARGGSTGQTDYTWVKGPSIGTWGIERRPDLTGVAAYVSLVNAESNGAANTAQASGRIPMRMYTEQPPSSPETGAEWVRATDKKIYTYHYGGWYDAMGNAMS